MRIITVRVFIGLAAMLIMTGCQPQLETGYVPRPLNSSEGDRRAYYAPEFSPESHATNKETGGTGLNFGR